MPSFWFLAGILTTLATLLLVMPLLRRSPRWSALPSVPWPAAAAAVVAVAALFVWHGVQSGPGAARAVPAASPTATPLADAGAFGTAAKVFGSSTGLAAATVPGTGSTPATAQAGSMDSAIASLEARLAKGGGTPDDWELLAKSFEFIGRPADAAKARAHQLPAMTAAAPAAAGAAVSGEVTLAPTLTGKASSGETVFIIAKSISSPGIPVAVYRGSVGSWPLKFKLDDSQSMMPGRNLSSAGRVTIEARISQKGQPLPSAGDLQGSSGPIDPADPTPLKIVIDHVIS